MSKLLSILVTALAITAIYGTNVEAKPNVIYQNTNSLAMDFGQKPKPVVKINKPAPKKEEPIKEAQVPKVITYKVQAGDTLSTIAQRHETEWIRIWSKNEALKHQDTLDVGQEIIIPNKEDVIPTRETIKPVQAAVSVPTPIIETAPTLAPTTPHRASHAVSAVSTPQPVSRPASSGEPNAYVWGWCTWYVKERRPDIGSFWGDARNWIASARSKGYSTGSVPQVGAIAQTYSGAYGHVAYVESIQGNSVTVSEMNYQGFGVVSTRTVPASSFQYIY